MGNKCCSDSFFDAGEVLTGSEFPSIEPESFILEEDDEEV